MELSEDFSSLQLTENIFKDVKFYVTGEVHDKVIELLKNGGADKSNYFSDYVTHLICGDDFEETDLSDATEVYEIPAVDIKWVYMCVKLKKIVDTKPYIFNPNKLFKGLTFSITGLKQDVPVLVGFITYNGGRVCLNFNQNCTHLISNNTSSDKFNKGLELGPEKVAIITPDWLFECIKNNCLIDPSFYHPNRIQWPKVVKHESTTAITGFEPDLNETVEKPVETSDSNTKALLDKLKQRMPWNQPQSEGPPPNVVAPSFAQTNLDQNQINLQLQQRMVQKTLTEQQQIQNIQEQLQQSTNALQASKQNLLGQNQVPRSIVHHTPQSNQQFTQNQSVNSNQAGLSRLLDQLHQRPGLPTQLRQMNQQNFGQIRGQIAQINQQGLLPHQINQQGNQNINQAQLGKLQQQLNQQGNLNISQGAQQAQNALNINQPTSMAHQIQQGQKINQQGQIGQPQILQQTQQGMIQRATLNQILKPGQNQLPQVQQQLMNRQLLQQQQMRQNLLQNQLAQQLSQQNQINQVGQTSINQQQLQNQNQLRQQQQQLQAQNQQLNQQQNQQLVQQNQLAQQLGQNNLVQQQLAHGQLNQQIRQSPLGQQIIQNQLVKNQIPQQINQNLEHLNQQTTNQLNQQQLVQNQQQIMQQQQLNQLTQSQNQIIPEQGNEAEQNANQNFTKQVVQGNFSNINQQPNQQIQGIQNQNTLMQNQFNQQQIVGSQNQTVVQNTGQQNIMAGQQQFVNNNQQFQQNQQQFNQNQTQNFAQNNQQTSQFGQQALLNQQQQLIQGQQQQMVQGQQQQMVQGQQQQIISHQQQMGQQHINNQLLQQQQAQQQLTQSPLQQQQGIQQQNLQQNQSQISNQTVQQAGQMQNVQQFNQNNQLASANIPNQQSPQRPINQIFYQQQQVIRHPATGMVQQGPRVQWSPTTGQQPGLQQRQYIQLDAQTHQQLQQMPPEQRALFVQKLQKQKLLQIQRQQIQLQQQRGGHILIRIPPGLNPQQQMQWLQQQAKQGVVLHTNIQQPQAAGINTSAIGQGNIQQNLPHGPQAPGLSPIQQNTPITDQNQQIQFQRHQMRLQQLQMQREQAAKNAQVTQQPVVPQGNVVRPMGQPQTVEANIVPDSTVPPNPLVNAKTKTALANMLSIRLQTGGTPVGPGGENIAEPSAAGTLRLMTAQHNAALNSSNRSQDLLTLQQRRTINGPNGEIIRPPGATSVPPSPQGEPPRLQYSPRNNIPLQHRPGPYYGHNPNLKLPPDLFLLGCIFVVVELEQFLDKQIPSWVEKIEKYGGEIEKQYCSRVTHVLCETQRHGVVMQALRDYKRCVTVYWLQDVMQRKQVLPPWAALHLPMIYMDISPLGKHLVAFCGFQGVERARVKQMITYTGASYTNYLSKHNTILIAAKNEGPKVTHAKKWNIPIVNIQWLSDIMLGNFQTINQMEHLKYQQYPQPPNFSFDPILVPNLMHAWKMPININQDSYEKVKRSPSPVVLPKKAKRLKTEIKAEEMEEQDENAPQSMTHRILFSRCTEVDEMKKIVRQLGGSLAKSHMDCTHLIMPQLSRTNKLLHCVCRGAYILPETWLKDSGTANKFLDECNYSLDTKDFNSEYKCDFGQTLATRNRNKLFEGKFFWITPSVFPSKRVLVELITSCGGIVERVRRSQAQIEATNINSPYSYIILTHEKDLHLVADLLKNKKDKIRIVCNVELILSAILRQTFEVDPYAVKVL